MPCREWNKSVQLKVQPTNDKRAVLTASLHTRLCWSLQIKGDNPVKSLCQLKEDHPNVKSRGHVQIKFMMIVKLPMNYHIELNRLVWHQKRLDLKSEIPMWLTLVKLLVQRKVTLRSRNRVNVKESWTLPYSKRLVLYQTALLLARQSRL